MSPPAPQEALPPPLPGPQPPEEAAAGYTGDGCPPGLDPTTCCVCSDHSQFEDPSHPHHHKFNDRALADELLEYLIQKERALDAERAELLSADDEADEDGIDEALGGSGGGGGGGGDHNCEDADDEDGSLADEIARRVVRPLPRAGRRPNDVSALSQRLDDGDEHDSLDNDDDSFDDDDDSGSEPPSSPESPTLAQMARGPPPTLQLGQKWVIRRAPPNVGQPSVGATAGGAQFDGQGRLKLGGFVGAGTSRFGGQQEHTERQRPADIVAGVAALSVADEPDEEPHSDGFHFTSSNLSKKRKIPSPFAGDHSPSGRASPSPQLPATLPPTSIDPAGGLQTMSSYLFPSFPALPIGYTRQFPPLPFSLRTRLVLARVSPSCRANIWAKAIWSERKMIIGRHGPHLLTDDEAWAVDFAGVGWGKGLLSEAVDAAHPKFRKEDSRRAKRGGMRGVQQKLSKDGLSLYAVVREEADWTSGVKRAARKPVPAWLENFAFTFTAESEASVTAAKVTRTLLALRLRLRLAPTSRVDLPSAAGPDVVEVTDPSTLPPRASSYGGITLAHSANGSGREAGQKKEKKVCLGRAADVKKKGGEAKAATAPVDDSSALAPAAVDEQPKKLTSSAKKAARKKAAAAAAAASVAAGNSPPPPLERTTSTASNGSAAGRAKPGSEQVSPSPPLLPPTGAKKKTKKKRSALANNSNPHHMKNYVPTRLVSDQPSQVFNPHAFMASLFFPPPTRFLTAVPAKLKASSAAAAAAAAAVPPAQPGAGDDAANGPAPGTDEYMCVFCEYTLLYGDSPSARRKLVSKRKKLLARKERARVRASGVANGTKTFASGTGGGSKQIRKTEQDDEDAYEGGEDWECDDEILPNGQCRRCSERRAHELDRKHKKNKKKKKGQEKASAGSPTDPVAGGSVALA